MALLLRERPEQNQAVITQPPKKGPLCCLWFSSWARRGKELPTTAKIMELHHDHRANQNPNRFWIFHSAQFCYPVTAINSQA